jgi:carbohydrate-selective porin OprB
MKRFLRFLLFASACAAAGAQPVESRRVSVQLSYTAEGFTNWSSVAYLGSLSAAVRFDLAGGSIVATAQQLAGHGIGETLGVVQAPSSLEAPPAARFGEAWYATQFLDGKVRVKTGRQYADSEFGAVDSAADFLNAAYGAIPTAPMPTYPIPEWGAGIWAAPSRNVSVGLGAFRGFTIVEGRFEAPYQTTFRLGRWRHGTYATAEHKFRGGSGAPAVFARWGGASDRHTPIAAYAGGGFVYRGAGIGVTSVRPSCGRYETAVEAFYKWRPREKLSLQPDVQWIARRFVAGVRVAIEW